MQKFLGVPYAAPPVGSLRWRPPITPAAWRNDQILNAVEFGNVCSQDTSSFPGFGYTKGTSEDCLYLNVFKPEKAKNGPREGLLSVIVLIPGGGLFYGGSNDYDPRWLVRVANVAFVSFNYRLGNFGFFSHPAINGEDHAAGNYGIMNQQLALTWVQNNIEAFGGDRNNVTIMGESAGGLSVMTHVASPRSACLFHRAIVQSGGSPPTIAFPSVESKTDSGIALASAAASRGGRKDSAAEQKTSAQELRALSEQEILAANALAPGVFGIGQYTVGLMEEGLIVPFDMRQRFKRGEFNRVPLLIGVNKDEFSWFLGMMELVTGQVLSAEMYPAALSQSLEMVAHFGVLGLNIPKRRSPTSYNATLSTRSLVQLGHWLPFWEMPV